MVVQGFSPTATLMHSSDTSYSEADYLSRNTIVVVALPIVSILLSLMRLYFRHWDFCFVRGEAVRAP